MISDGHLIPSGIDFGTPASAFQKQEAPTLIFMTQSQETSAFLAIFVQFPPATAKTQPRTWHHYISASPSGGNAATRIPCLQLQGLTTHLLGLLEKRRKCFGNTRIKIRIMKNEQNWLGFFLFFTPSMFLRNFIHNRCLKYSWFCVIRIPSIVLLQSIPGEKGHSGSVSAGQTTV